MRLHPFLLLLAFALLGSCRKQPSTVIFHSGFGEMTVRISPRLPERAAGLLEQLLERPPDSLVVDRVLHDGFIQLNFQGAVEIPDASTEQAPLTGTFILRNGRFFIVQGRAQTDASLNKWELSSGKQLTPTLREQFKKHGGALQLTGNCVVLGRLESGKEVLDRIAALPNDANGRPLREVPVWLEGRE